MEPIPRQHSGLPGLLRLTPDIRRLIYEHAGIVRRHVNGQLVPALYNLGYPSHFTARRRAYELEEYQTFHGLLLSCQTVYTEASALLYSANWFIIRYQPRRTLAPLCDLTPHALAHLTHLKVVLNESSCHQDKGICDGEPGCCNTEDPETRACCDDWGYTSHDPPLAGPALLAFLASAEWNVCAARLAAHITPGQLELSLVCDVAPGGLDTARVVLLDSLRMLPPLKDCHIRLSTAREPRLQELAQAAVFRARGITPRDPPAASSRAADPSFPGPLPYLLMLPPELRLRILEYTDLVTPWKEVYWSRSSGYGILRALCENSRTGKECPSEFHGGCQFAQCQQVRGYADHPTPRPLGVSAVDITPLLRLVVGAGLPRQPFSSSAGPFTRRRAESSMAKTDLWSLTARAG